MAMSEIARLKAPITGAALVAFLHHHPGAVVTAGATRPPCLIISIDEQAAEVPRDPGEKRDGAGSFDQPGAGGVTGTSVAGDVHVHNT